jgi:glycosyltransferase involved in cell wall biosynthesis
MPGRVLVVAYNFPPVGGVGVQRTLKYVTYLPQSGWEPVVLTARDPGKYPRDEEAERSLPPDLVVERALSPEPVKLRRALGRAARRLRGDSGAGAGAPGRDRPASPGPKVAAGSKSLWTGRLLGLWGAATRLTFFPDEEVSWVPFAIGRGMEIQRRAPVDAIYSSSGPVSCHLVAAVIARRTGLPWIADFRDPWIGNAFAAPLPAAHAQLQRQIERRIVHLADRSIFATSGLLDAYAARYPEVAGRFLAIPNGYDRRDLPALEAAPAPRPDGRFRLVYGGSVYGEQELEIFLTGLERLVARRPEIRDQLEVEFIGWLNLRNQAIAAGYSEPDRLGPMIRLTGFLPHREAVARFLAADALLQLIADGPNKGQIQGGKLMEYVGLDRQILAVVPEGQAREILRELNWGIAVDPTPEAVADGVERLLATPLPQGRADPQGRYNRVNLTRRMAEQLDAVVEGRKAG